MNKKKHCSYHSYFKENMIYHDKGDTTIHSSLLLKMRKEKTHYHTINKFYILIQTFEDR